MLVPLAQAEISSLRPDIVVVSGDVSNGVPEALNKARKFIDSLPGEKIVVPGNTDHYPMDLTEDALRQLEKPDQKTINDLHYMDDASGKNIAKSHFFEPLFPLSLGADKYYVGRPHGLDELALIRAGQKKFSLYPSEQSLAFFHKEFEGLEKTISSPLVTVVGLNSTHPTLVGTPQMSAAYGDEPVYLFQRHDGILPSLQLDKATSVLSSSKSRVNIVVLHHPLIRHPASTYFGAFWQEKETVRLLSAAGTNIVLAGHKHIPFVAQVPSWSDQSKPTVHITANTLLDKEIKPPYVKNSYFIIDIEKNGFLVRMKELGNSVMRKGAIYEI